MRTFLFVAPIAVLCIVVALLWQTTPAPATLTLAHYTTGVSYPASAFNSKNDAIAAAVNALDAGKLDKTAFQASTGIKANPRFSGTATFRNTTGIGDVQIINGQLWVRGQNGTYYHLVVTGGGFNKLSSVTH